MTIDLSRLLDHKIFADIDTDALVARYDNRQALRESLNGLAAASAEAEPASSTISSIPPGGVLIDTPGVYTLANDVTWTPHNAFAAAITITSGGVTLDLNGKTLAVAASTPEATLMAIAVNPAVKDGPRLQTVDIKNGVLDGFTRIGLCALGVDGMTIAGVTARNGDFVNTTDEWDWAAGFMVVDGNNVTFQACAAENLKATAPALAGFVAAGSSAITTENCLVSALTNLDGVCQGYSFIATEGVTQSSCRVNRLQTHYQGLTPTVGHTCIGYVYTLCSSGQVTHCSAADITGCCDDAHGMSVFVAAEFDVTGFLVSNVVDGPDPYMTGAKATGLEVYGWGVTLTSCNAQMIKAFNPQDLQSAGFSAWGGDIVFNQCVAGDVQVVNTPSFPEIATGYGVGFGWAPDPRDEFAYVDAIGVTYQNCHANACQVGFDTWKHVSSSWLDCMASGCLLPMRQEPDGTVRVMTMTKCSESPTGGPYSKDITNTAADNTVQPPMHSAASPATKKRLEES